MGVNVVAYCLEACIIISSLGRRAAGDRRRRRRRKRKKEGERESERGSEEIKGGEEACMQALTHSLTHALGEALERREGGSAWGRGYFPTIDQCFVRWWFLGGGSCRRTSMSVRHTLCLNNFSD